MLGSHAPATWHWSLATQVTGVVPVQTPARQASAVVHGLPSSMVAGIPAMQAPAALHVDAPVQTSPAEH